MRKILRLIFVFFKIVFAVFHVLLPNKGFFRYKLKFKLENRIIFSPRFSGRYPIKEALKGEFEPVRLITNDCVKIYGWFFMPKKNKPTVVFCHGKSESILKWQDTAIMLKNNGFGVFFLSYRGHYRSAGLPSEQGIYNDAQTVINFLNSKDISTENIIFWGRSLGTAVAVEMAYKNPIKALILESSIKDIQSATCSMGEYYTKSLHLHLSGSILMQLFKNIDFIQHFDNASKLPYINCPILIMHSKNDKKVPFSVAEYLNSLNKNSELFLSEEGSHQVSQWCYEKVVDFVSNLVITK